MTELHYISTRDKNNRVTASQAILKGIAEDGGLYVPTTMPQLSLNWETLQHQSYQEIAFPILKAFLTDFSDDELKYCIHSAYDTTFDDPAIAPVKKVGNAYIMELFHGRTIAFKDMALSILPYLLTTAAKKNQQDKDIVILTATSGDTGKAALAGFADVPHTKIIVFYPKGGVSTIQERQMVTQTGDNTFVYGVKGNFDDAQTMVKKLFNDATLNQTLAEKGFQLSSANSINIGRLCPQVVYYVYAYAQLVKQGALQIGEAMNVVVPTGNFGNILAAYYAKQLGVPIQTLVCASNENDVLVDFFHTGTYNRQRKFEVTSSPSMDILVSSNLERLIFEMTGSNAKETKALMDSLTTNGHYHIEKDILNSYEEFYAARASQEETAETIESILSNENDVLVDFFHTGTYNRQRKFEVTSSPSMDILVSSNLERLIFEMTGSNAEETKALMDSLTNNGQYHIEKDVLNSYEEFYAARASQEETAQTIESVLSKENYLLDPHTAVAQCAYDKYQQETKDITPTVIVSTASPYKFPQSVVSAVKDSDVTALSDQQLIDEVRQLSGVEIPLAVTSVLEAEIRHTRVLEISEMKQSVYDSLNI